MQKLLPSDASRNTEDEAFRADLEIIRATYDAHKWPHPRVDHLRKLLGTDVLLLAWPNGSKGTERKWKHLTVEAMCKSAYLDKLEAGNIGVALGKVSNGVCSIDLDSDEFLQAFIMANPLLRRTLQSRGARGGNLWVRCTGDYPKTFMLKGEDGSKAGEWRSTGNQTIISGLHPSGVKYRLTVEEPPVEITFASIIWPSCIRQPRRKDEDAVDLLPEKAIEHSNTAHTENTATQQLRNSETQAVSVRASFFDILAFIPTARHESDAKLWDMAGALLTWERQEGLKASNSQKMTIFKHWWELSAPHVDPAVEQAVFCAKWLSACSRRKFASDETPLHIAFKKAQTEPLPPAATGEYDVPMSERMKVFVAFLAQLQTLAGKEPFYLSSRNAGELFQVAHTTAFLWLEILAAKDGPYRLLTKVSIGSQAAHKANEYRFHPPAEQ